MLLRDLFSEPINGVRMNERVIVLLEILPEKARNRLLQLLVIVRGEVGPHGEGRVIDFCPAKSNQRSRTYRFRAGETHLAAGDPPHSSQKENFLGVCQAP